jgi:hypothetical protein
MAWPKGKPRSPRKAAEKVGPPPPIAEVSIRPSVAPERPTTPIQALCAYLGIGLGEVKSFEDGGETLELVTRQGTRHRVERRALPL